MISTIFLLSFLFDGAGGQSYVTAAFVTAAASLSVGIFNTVMGAILKSRYDRKLEEEKRKSTKEDRRLAVYEVIRDKKIQEGQDKADALNATGKSLMSQLKALAEDSGTLSDDNIIKTMELTLVNFGAYRSQLDSMENDLPELQRTELENVERLAVKVILDVARVKADRIARADKMKEYVPQLEAGRQTMDRNLSVFTPKNYRDDSAVQEAANA